MSNEREKFFPANKKKEQDELFESAEQDKKMNYSEFLIKEPIKEGEPGYDKIFILGKVRQEKGKQGETIWRVKIESETPAVALNQKIKDKFNLKDLPIIQDIRKRKQKFKDYSLISGGSFVWLSKGGNSKLVLLRRDEQAPTDPGCLTGPAGRCGEPPSSTTVNETNEELIIIKSKTASGKDHFSLLGFYRKGKISKEEIIRQKLRQVEKIYNHLISIGKEDDAKLLRLIRGEDDICAIDISTNILKSKEDDKINNKVITEVNGEEIDIIDGAVTFFDKGTNTLEIREVVNVNLPEDIEIVKTIDGETFGREVVTVASLQDLKKEQCVFALKKYIDQSLKKQ